MFNYKKNKILLTLILVFIANNKIIAINKNIGINDNRLEGCSLISDDATRLKCYDDYVNTNKTSKDIITNKQNNSNNYKDNNSTQISSVIDNKNLNTNTNNFFVYKEEDKSYLDNLYDLHTNNNDVFTIKEHNLNYIIPLWYTSHTNPIPQSYNYGASESNVANQRHLETKFQISLKTKVLENILNTNTNLWLGYTQTSYFQSYNKKDSYPFRETDYKPEIFFTTALNQKLPFGFKLKMIGGGLLHHSNGRNVPFSRSWNRAYMMAGIEKNNFTIIYKQLYPFIFDDNPDARKYYGNSDLYLQYKSDKNLISLNLHGNVFRKDSKIGTEVRYSIPIKGNLNFFLTAFYGYGENFIDYNFKTKGIGIGILFDNIKIR